MAKGHGSCGASLQSHTTLPERRTLRFDKPGQESSSFYSLEHRRRAGPDLSSTKEFLHHLSMAYGSLREVETQVLIAERLRYLTQEEARNLMEPAAEVGRLLNGLSSALRKE